jgi:hypothetical protein
MSALDEIIKEKQRVSEALAHVEIQRKTLIGQFGDLQAAESVLARYSKGTRTKKTASARTPTTAPNAVTPAPSRGRPRATTATAASGKHSSPSLADQVLALATGNTQQEIAAACKGARPNHIGISRQTRAGRIEERDGKLYGTQSTETERRAMLGH